jgi:hypothetical protein
LKKAGLLKKDRGRITLRPHNLRKFFRTHGKWKQSDIAEALMGHNAGRKAVYARYDQAEEKLAEAYLEAEPSLSIYSYSTTVVELRQKVDKQSEDIEELITNLSVKNVRLEKEVDSLKDFVMGLSAQIENLEETLIRYQESIPPDKWEEVEKKK